MFDILMLGLLACDGGASGDKPTDTAADSADTGSGVDSVPDSPDTADSDTAEDSQPPMDTDRETLEISIDDASVKLTGEAAEAAATRMDAASAGDLDGDGLDDIAIGMPSYLYAGYAYVESGAKLASGSLSDATAALAGSERATCVGSSVAAAGDLDGDGYGDLVVGDHCYETDWGQPGRAFVFTGPLSGTQDAADAATATLIGEWVYNEAAPMSATGSSVAGAGDYTGDGIPDILVGAPNYDGYSGAAYVVAGPVSSEIDLGTYAALRVTGWGDGNVAGAGDTNGDGLTDVAIGSGGGTECARVFAGPTAGDLLPEDADTVVTCVVEDVGGIAPAGAGDVDGDGYDDILVDAVGHDEGDTNVGAAYMFLGPFDAAEQTSTADATLVGTTKGNVGASLDSAGDTNGDGYADILIGAPTSGWEEGTLNYAGTAYLVLSPVYGTFALDGADLIIHGSDADEVGTVVAPAGDVDGDGLGDLLVAGAGDADGGEDAGAVWVLYAASLW